METKSELQMQAPGVYTLLTGAAAKVFSYEKSALKIDGTIPSVVEFFNKRFDHLSPELQKAVLVKFNKSSHKLELIIDENHPLQDVITCKIQFNPDFTAFGINAEKYWGVKEFAKFLKTKRSFFPEIDQYTAILSKLNNFKATVNAEVDNKKDDRGNKSDHFDRVVKTELPETMVLSVEIVKGTGKKKIVVDIGHEVFDSEVKIWLFSNDAIELTEKLTTEAFDSALNIFREKDVPCFEY